MMVNRKEKALLKLAELIEDCKCSITSANMTEGVRIEVDGEEIFTGDLRISFGETAGYFNTAQMLRNLADNIEDQAKEQTTSEEDNGVNFSLLRHAGAPVSGAGAQTGGPLGFMDIFDKRLNR